MKILVAIDDSQFSELALESVKLRQWEQSTEFMLCSIVPEICHEQYLTAAQQEVARKAESNLLHSTRAFVNSKWQGLRTALPGNLINAEVRIGPVAVCIIDLAEDFDADLIILGSHCRHGLSKLAMGSVVEAVVSAAQCSVEIIRSHSAREQATETPCLSNLLVHNKILICYDGSQNAKYVLDWISRAQWAPEQEFVVLTVLAPSDDARLNVKQKRRNVANRAGILADAENMLEKAISPLRRNPNLRVLQPEVCEGFAAETILQFAGLWGADAIMLGAHAEAPSEDPLLGSVARKVATDARCSVRVMRARFMGAERNPRVEQKSGGAAQVVSKWAIDRVRRAGNGVAAEKV